MVTDTHAGFAPRQGGYLAKKCLEAAAKDNMPATYPAELKAPYSPFTLALMNSGNVFEDTVGAAITDALGDRALVIVEHGRTADGERTLEGKLAKERDTFEAVIAGTVEIIFNARIASHFEELMAAHLGLDTPVLDPNRVSEADAMVRGPRLPNGLWSWYPVDVKDHKAVSGPSKPRPRLVAALTDPGLDAAAPVELEGQLNKDDWYQLAHYYRHFQSVGIATERPFGAVIGRPRDGRLELLWHDLTEATFQAGQGSRTYTAPLDLYDRDFAAGLAVVRNARARDLDPTVAPVVGPEWKSDCAECPWRTVCLAELKAQGDGAGHITLLPGVTPARAAELYYPAGITTADELAALADVDVFTLDWAEQAGKKPADARKKAEAVRKDVAQALVTLSGVPHRAEGRDALDLPCADVELDIDLESDERLYLYGIATTRRGTGKDGQFTYRRSVTLYDDYSNTDAGEAKVYLKTWAHLTRAISRAGKAGQSIRIYHYSPHERTWFRNMAAKYQGLPGAPTVEEMADFLTCGVLVDMYTVTRSQVVWPTMSHSIKKLAPLAGFAWRDSQAGGDQSIAWYRDAVAAHEAGDRAGVATQRARLRRYNSDDVLATAKLRAWLYSQGTPQAPGAAFPSVEELAVA